MKCKGGLRSEASLLAVLLANAVVSGVSYANPQGGVVSAGQAGIANAGRTLTVTQTTDKAVIDWRSFDIGAGETTTFHQPSSSSITLNRVNSAAASVIDGNLNANGNLVIVNQNGVLFGKNARVDVNGLLATTADVDNDKFMSSATPSFDKPGNPNASIENQGIITAADAGLVGLVAPQVLNLGTITAKYGRIHLASGDKATLDLYGDGLMEIEASAALQAQLVDNTGTLNAEGGTITLTAAAAAQTVNSLVHVGGELKANAVGSQNGVVEIFAEGSNAVKDNVAANKSIRSGSSAVTVDGSIDVSNASGKGGKITVTGDNVTLSKTATIKANGTTGGGTIAVGGALHGAGTTPTALTTNVEAGSLLQASATGNGDGGTISIWSDKRTSYFGALEAKAGPNGGNGGFAEVSGKSLVYRGSVNLRSDKGMSGTLLLDPEDVSIQASGTSSDTCSEGVCTPAGDPTSILLVSDLQTALASSNVTVNTGSTGSQPGNITVANNLTWATGNLLTLSAAGGITIGTGVTISNTYAGSTFGAGSIPVVLALRADNAGPVDGSGISTNVYGVTNYGTINMSGSKGAVSIFNDVGFTAVNGTQTANGSWTSPTNYSVSTQFTTYKLINGVGDLANIALGTSGSYAIGSNIDGGGNAFNSNTPISSFSGILDGQWCALGGGSACAVTNLTMTSNATYVGLIGNNNGKIRNLTLGLNVTDTSANTSAEYIGTVAGYNIGTIANVTATGNVTYTTTVSGSSTSSPNIGGLTGIGSFILYNDSATGTVSYTYSGTSTGTSSVGIGGLVGLSSSSQINVSSASGTVSVGSTTSGNVNVYLGGLVGLANNGTIANSSADSLISDTLGGAGTQYIGGVIGQTGTAGSITDSGYTRNLIDISYGGSGTVYLGGFVGFSPFNYVISGVYNDVDVNFTNTVSGTSFNHVYIGGFAGRGDGSFTTITTNGDVTYTYAGTTTNSVSVDLGGLAGVTGGNVYSDVINSDIKAQYANGYSGSVSATIGLVSGANSGIIDGVTPTGTITDTLGGNKQTIGWITGFCSYCKIQNITNSTTDISYTGNASTIYIGGVAGSAWSSTLVNVNNTRNVSVTTTGSTSAAIGGLVGEIETSTIQNSGSSGNVTYNYQGGTGTVEIGGLVGLVGYGTASISASSSTGHVTAQNVSGYSGNVTAYVGGIIGSGALSISSTTLAGSVTDSLAGIGSQYFGALIGRGTAGTVTNVSNANTTLDFAYTGTGDVYVGGIAGQVTGGTYTYVYNHLPIDITYSGSGTAYVGGVFGSASAVSYAYNDDPVSVTVTGTNANTVYIGGIAGTATSITNSTTTGDVAYTFSGTGTSLGSSYIGGLAGSLGSADSTDTISGNVTAQNASGHTGNINGFVGGLAGKTTGTINGVTPTGTITDTLEGGCTQDIGWIVGTNNGATISNVTNNTVSLSYTGAGSTINIGGIAGFDVQGTYTNVVNNMPVSGTKTGSNTSTFNIGGLVGIGTTAAATTISGSHATGAVTFTHNGTGTSSAYAGGIIGDAGLRLSNSFSTAPVSAQYGASTSGTVNVYIGGLAGITYNVATSSISTSYATGTVSSSTSNGNEYLGGLVGWNISSIINSYALGAVVYSGTATPYIGGLVGSNRSNVSLSFAAGLVSSSTGTKGGLIGYNNGGTSSNSYWDVGASGQASSAGGSGILASNMTAQASFSGFDFTSVWSIAEGKSYPYLQWQGTPSIIAGTGNLSAGQTIRALVNGTAIGSAIVGGDSSYYFMLPQGTISAGSNILLYNVGGGASAANAVYAAGDNLAAGLVMDSNTLWAGSGNGALTNTVLASALGGFSSADILYTASGNNLTISAPTTTLTNSGTGGITVNGAIASSGAIVLQTASGTDITIDEGGSLVSTAAGDAIKVISDRNFINNAGSSALTASNGRWLVYSASPSGDTFGDLNSNNRAVWNTAGGATIAASGNRYVFSYQPTVTFTSGNLTKTYGEDITTALATDYSMSGVEGGVLNAFLADTSEIAFSGAPSISSSGALATAGVLAGPYAVTVGTGSLAVLDGYAVSLNSVGTITINKATVTITADDKSMTYGGVMPSFTASYSGWVNGEDASVLTTAPQIESGTAATANAGIYADTLSASGATAANYTFTYLPGTLTIEKALLTVTADGKTMTYGGAMPTLTASYSGFVNGDTETALTTAPSVTSGTLATADAGTYTNTLTASGATAANYTFAYVPGTMTIGKAALTVVPNDTTIHVGDALPPLTGSNDLVAQDASLVSWAYTPVGYAGTAGTYTITATAADPLNRLANYIVTEVDGHLLVLPKIQSQAQIPPSVQASIGGSLVSENASVPSIGFTSLIHRDPSVDYFNSSIDLMLSSSLLQILGYRTQQGQNPLN